MKRRVALPLVYNETAPLRQVGELHTLPGFGPTWKQPAGGGALAPTER